MLIFSGLSPKSLQKVFRLHCITVVLGLSCKFDWLFIYEHGETIKKVSGHMLYHRSMWGVKKMIDVHQNFADNL